MEFIEQRDENGWIVPVWISYPDYRPWDLVWYPGSCGEGYARHFHGFIDGLPENVLEKYKEKYPVPAGWKAWVTKSTDENMESIRKQDAADYWAVHEWMTPPWDEFESYDPFCIGWRMGNGETYAYEFGIFIEALSDEDLIKYREMHPAPPGWRHWLLKDDDPDMEDVTEEDWKYCDEGFADAD